MQRGPVSAQFPQNLSVRSTKLVSGKPQHRAGCRPIAPASVPDSALLPGETGNPRDFIPRNKGLRSDLRGALRHQFQGARDPLLAVFVPTTDAKRLYDVL